MKCPQILLFLVATLCLQSRGRTYPVVTRSSLLKGLNCRHNSNGVVLGNNATYK